MTIAFMVLAVVILAALALLVKCMSRRICRCLVFLLELLEEPFITIFVFLLILIAYMFAFPPPFGE